MAGRTSPPPLDLTALLPSWELALRAERKPAQTIKNYTTGVYQFLDWREDNDETRVLDRDLVRRFVA